MNIFKKLVFPSLSSSSAPERSVASYLKSIRFHGIGQLPLQYESLLQDALLLTGNAGLFLEQLVRQTNRMSETLSITHGKTNLTNPIISEKQEELTYKHLIKMLCIIHTYVKKRHYDKQDIESLTELAVGTLREEAHNKLGQKNVPKKVATERITITDEGQSYSPSTIWISNLITCYCQYLVKIPSMSDIFQQCYDLYQNRGLRVETPPSFQLTHIFRIIHQVQIILKWVHNAVNVVGRYQSIKYPEFRELYRIISGELVAIHYYLKYLIDNIFNQYKVYDVLQLRCFLDVLPEIELTSDRIEDLLVNKYFKGNRILIKIELKEEKVAELMYYLDYEYTGQEKKGGSKRQKKGQQN